MKKLDKPKKNDIVKELMQNIEQIIKRHYVIGDVHASGKELFALIEKIGPKADDEIILVGDVFDRGFHGKMVWNLIQKNNLTVLRGNHEQKMLAFLKGERDSVPTHYHWVLNDLINTSRIVTKDDLISYLESLPILIERNNALIAHAGVNILNPTEPNISCNVYGNPTPFDRRPGQKWWEQYEMDQMVVYGHLIPKDLKPMFAKNSRGIVNSVCIDTAVCHGHQITAFCIETKEIIQYQSGIDHFSLLKQEMRKNPPLFKL